MLPETGWPFLTIAIALALFSNVLIGAFSYGTLLMMAVLLSRSNYQVFFLFFIAGMIGILLFSKLDTDYKTGIPIFVSFTIFVVIETCFIVLFSEEALTLEDFLILGINVFITFLILIILLRYYSFHVIHKYRENYMEINDPECVLLVELKNKSQFDYYQAVHTAYLSAKIARRIGLKCEVAKAGGYYLRIGKLKGENTKENILSIGEVHHFPPELMSLLLECNSKPVKIITKEAAIVMYSEAVVTSIMFLFQKDNKAVLDYEQIVDVIFKKKMSDGILSKCQITYEELCIMKKMFGEEKLYYDFLR